MLLFTVLAAFAVRADTAAAGGSFMYGSDDSYIEMAVARHLATGGVWGVTPYEFSGGSTTLAWPIVLAAVRRVAGAHDAAGFVLNVLCALLLLGAANLVLERHVRGAWLRALCLCAIVVGASLSALALMGMEHSLQSLAALVFAAATLRASADPPSRRRFVAAMIVAAAVMMSARFDTGAVLVPVVIWWLSKREWRIAAAVTAAAALPVALYALVATAHGWPALPASVLLLSRLSDAGTSTLRDLVDLAGYGGLAMLLGTPVFMALTFAALALLALGLRGDRSEGARECRLLLWIFLAAEVVHFQGSRSGEPYLFRYEAYLVPLGIVAAGAALGHVLEARRVDRWSIEWWATAAIGIVLLQPLVQRGVRMERVVVDGARAISREEYPLGRLFAGRTWPAAVVFRDVLGSTYWADLRVVDLDGLANADVTEALRQGPLDAAATDRLARAHGARYAVIAYPATDIPESWIRVADWADEGRPLFAFYALDPAAAEQLGAALAGYDARLPAGIVRIGPR